MAVRLSYGRTDAALIDWNAAVLLETGSDPQASADAVQVLEFVNVELLEMRQLDDQLDDSLEEAYATVNHRRRRRGRVQLAHIAQLQMDASLLFEGVNNALKLVGDQYLARLYRLAATRMHLPDWDASIIRKLSAIESLYEKLSDRQSERRMEILEWIIIVLIAVSIVLPFIPGFGGK